MIPFTIAEATPVAGVAIQAVTELDQGLTLAELVRSIPHDISAMVVYAMLFGSVLFAWRAGRSAGSAKEAPITPESGSDPGTSPL
jgi:hypothetical protein